MADLFKTSQRPTFFYIKRIIGAILLLALAAVFLFSAISKLYSIEAFEWTFIDMGISSIATASIFAHFFIGLELAIGLFLLFHIYLKQVTYPTTMIMLLLLTGYLVLLIAKQGNTGSCGCFGDWIYMNPLNAIWKNLAMIAATIVLMYIYPIKPYKNQEWIAATIGMAGLVAPMIISPLNLDNEPKMANRTIDLSPLYKESNPPRQDLTKGKHIVAFMSLTCPHCKKAAYLLQTIKREHSDIPVFLVLSGAPELQDDFFKETHAQALPHLLMTDKDAFVGMAGEYVPAIYWINDSVIEKESNYYQLDPAIMQKWLKN